MRDSENSPQHSPIQATGWLMARGRVLGLLLLCASCSEEPLDATSARIGPAGGTLTHKGVTLEVPPGALASETTLTITATRDQAPAGYTASSPVYRFDPAGLVFARKVTVTFGLDGSAAGLSIFWSRIGSGGLDNLGGVVADRRISASVQHFSTGFAGTGSGMCGTRICSKVQCWAQGCSPDHCDATADNRYDIWQANCHSAANSCVLKNPSSAGIVSCGGQPQCLDNPGDHTFNYIVNANGSITYWNWGTPCGPCPGPAPAAINATDCHGQCIKTACGTQFDGNESILPLGETVEIPGPSTCVTKVSQDHGGSKDQKWGPECYDCCDERADVWSNDKPNYKQRQCDREDFRHACKELCQGTFGMPKCPYSPSVGACKADGSGPREPADIKTDCTALAKGYKLTSIVEKQCLHVCIDMTMSAARKCPCPPPPDAGVDRGPRDAGTDRPASDSAGDAARDGPGTDGGPGDSGTDGSPVKDSEAPYSVVPPREPWRERFQVPLPQAGPVELRFVWSFAPGWSPRVELALAETDSSSDLLQVFAQGRRAFARIGLDLVPLRSERAYRLRLVPLAALGGHPARVTLELLSEDTPHRPLAAKTVTLARRHPLLVRTRAGALGDRIAVQRVQASEIGGPGRVIACR